MAEIATYTWSTFEEEDAKFGLRVGFQQTNDYDLSMTGILTEARRYTKYKAVIDGRTLFINDKGVVKKTIPDSEYTDRTVKIVTCEMKTSYGTSQAITRGVSGDSEEVATLDAMEPRDQFAIYAMQGIMAHLGMNPAEMDDANILFNCRAAYRWAQGMMIASADARADVKKQQEDEGGEGGGSTPAPAPPSPDVDPEEEEEEELKKHLSVNTNAITSMTDKLLYNLGLDVQNLRIQQSNEFKKIKADGLKVSGSDKEDAKPIIVAGTDDEDAKPVQVQLPEEFVMKVEGSGDQDAEPLHIQLPDDYEMPVKIEDTVTVEVEGTPDVNISNTPDVHVTNTPDVSVTNMPDVPSEPVTISGTVSVDNFPESSTSSNSNS